MDFTTLYPSLPHARIKHALHALIQELFAQHVERVGQQQVQQLQLQAQQLVQLQQLQQLQQQMEQTAALEKKAKQITDAKQPFERVVVTKEECLELFKNNPFKVAMISGKLPEGSSMASPL